MIKIRCFFLNAFIFCTEVFVIYFVDEMVTVLNRKNKNSNCEFFEILKVFVLFCVKLLGKYKINRIRNE